MYDLLIKEFKQKVINLCNESGFTPTVLFYIFKDLNEDIERAMKDNIYSQELEKLRNQVQELQNELNIVKQGS